MLPMFIEAKTKRTVLGAVKYVAQDLNDLTQANGWAHEQQYFGFQIRREMEFFSFNALCNVS